jgi:hypothetical protein
LVDNNEPVNLVPLKSPLNDPVKDEPVKLLANTLLVAETTPLILTLPVNVCTSSSELPDTVEPDLNEIDELTKTVSY